jgi:hypothetical protein
MSVGDKIKIKIACVRACVRAHHGAEVKIQVSRRHVLGTYTYVDLGRGKLIIAAVAVSGRAWEGN